MKAFVAELADLLRGVADGTPPPADSELTVVLPPDERSVGVLAFPGQHIIVADVSAEWVRSWLPADDLSAPLGPRFLTLLSAVTGREIGTIDAVLVARAHGRRRGLELVEVTDSDHPRIARARRQRADVRAWACPGGVLVLGRGVAGRWEAAVEVEPALRGFGLGRGLFGAALGLLPEGESVWTQVAPGNAASLRALLAAGYHPIGAEVLLEPRAADDGEPIEWFGSYLPAEDWQDNEPEPAEPEGAPEPAQSAAEPPPGPPPAEPPQAEPLTAEPVRAEPLRAEPVRAEPLRAEPAAAEPVPAEHQAASVPVEEVPFEPVTFRLPPIEAPPKPRPVSADRGPIDTPGAPSSTEELAAAEAEAAAELDADEDTELAERDEPLS
jgi:GNAT superfamily N-acetyltransferase